VEILSFSEGYQQAYLNGYTERGYSPDGGNTLYPIWHAGNFSPSAYLPLTGGTLAGELNIGANVAQKNLNVNGNIKTRKNT
jgi:hypothetical protein